MRLAALLLLVVPSCAMAQSPPTPPKPAAPDHKPALDHKLPAKPPAKSSTPEPKPPASKPTPAQPIPAKPAATKRTPGKPTPGKPTTTKPASTKPTARKPAPPAAHPAAPVVPAPAPEAAPAEPGKGSNTGLPIPRFAALRSDDVNFRSGPGTRYPIEWVYKRRDLPVEIEREFEIWRLVRDPQGNKGWVHQATLVGRRTAVTVGTEHALRAAAADTASPVATLKPGVIIRLRSCDANSEWCQAQIADYRGYIKRVDIWGLEPGEVIQ